MDEQPANVPVVIATDTIGELHRFLEDPLLNDKLRKTLYSYVKNLLHTPQAEIEDEAYELMHDVVVKAIEIADKYHGAGMMPWLLRIAINLLRQKRKSLAVHREKVVSLGDLHKQNYPALNDEEFFELFTVQIAAAHAQKSRLYQELKEAISGLSEGDRVILNYYINYGYDHNEIAHILNIKPGAARARYSRAVSRLRDKLVTCSGNDRGGDSDA
ncbi:MAG TPA: sigma-70 family RNA polymerase sigma factor [Ktedonobacteraceae bacterium]|nr:sigma-70 family RNA polymerase sigma factor [Ktedonobacteraceae bacterium]